MELFVFSWMFVREPLICLFWRKVGRFLLGICLFFFLLAQSLRVGPAGTSLPFMDEVPKWVATGILSGESVKILGFGDVLCWQSFSERRSYERRLECALMTVHERERIQNLTSANLRSFFALNNYLQ